MPDCDETFRGGQGQERLSPEQAQSVDVRARKGREIQILAVQTEKKQLFWPMFWLRMVPRWCPMQFGDAISEILNYHSKHLFSEQFLC